MTYRRLGRILESIPFLEGAAAALPQNSEVRFVMRSQLRAPMVGRTLHTLLHSNTHQVFFHLGVSKHMSADFVGALDAYTSVVQKMGQQAHLAAHKARVRLFAGVVAPLSLICSP